MIEQIEEIEVIEQIDEIEGDFKGVLARIINGLMCV